MNGQFRDCLGDADPRPSWLRVRIAQAFALARRDRPLPILWVSLLIGLAVVGDAVHGVGGEAVDRESRLDAPTITIEIDAQRLPRRLLEARLQIPVEPAREQLSQPLILWYPKWVPGAHAPGGPIANLAGLIIEDEQGQSLQWRRTAGEVFRVEVDVPPELEQVIVRLRYITNQPTTNSFGTDSFGSSKLGVINFNTICVIPEAADIDTWQIAAKLDLPKDWKLATALPAIQRDADDPADRFEFQPVSLRTLVDSPVMCGEFHRAYDLVEQDRREQISPHRLHIFSEAPSVLEIHPEVLANFRRMVTQTALLFGSHPFAEFEILLATTNVLPANGLEHARSSFNVLGQRVLQAPDHLQGWNRLLIPHEYVHAWCGKYRLPQGMLTQNFHQPLDTELLWVYEGLTQYLGELLEVRCGLMSADEFRHRLAVEVRQAMYQQGREWRSLADTGAASHVLRGGSAAWSRLRRGQDYYFEGMLFWLEADALIRRQTAGQRSLDDFCRVFFACDDPDTLPQGYDMDEVVATLRQTAEFDWQGLIHRRLSQPTAKFDPAVVELLGYSIQFANRPPEIPESTFRRVAAVDAYDSLGCTFSNAGEVQDVLLDSAADHAGLGPGMRVVAVNNHAWSVDRMLDAIAMSATSGPIELWIANGDSFETLKIDYRGGPRYFSMVPRTGAKDVLAEILAPR